MALELERDGPSGHHHPRLLLPPTSFLHHPVDDEYSRNARSAAKLPGILISQRGLYCQTQFSLQILANGKINGTKNYLDKFTVLNFIPIGSNGKMYIQGVASDRYLCMGMDGRLYGSRKATDDCVLVEQMDPILNLYSTYNSYKYSTARRKWYVALSKMGRARKGNLSRKRNKSIRFMRYMPNYDRSRFKPLAPASTTTHHKQPAGSGSRNKDRKRKQNNDVRRRRDEERKKRRRPK